MIHVWLTKYALTRGIEEADAEICENTSTDMIVFCADPEEPQRKTYIHYEGIDWHRSRESAVQRANNMIRQKVLSAEKQLKRLRGLHFE